MQSEHHLGHGYFLIGKLSIHIHKFASYICVVYRFIKINAVDETNNSYAVMTAN